jgi:hypothetical protein
VSYPIEGIWSLKLYGNTTTTRDSSRYIVLWCQYMHPEEVPELESKKMVNGAKTSVGDYRLHYDVRLEPFVFPDHMSDYRAVTDFLKANRYYWLESVTYPDPISLAEVSITSVKYEHKDETAEKSIIIHIEHKDI